MNIEKLAVNGQNKRPAPDRSNDAPPPKVSKKEPYCGQFNQPEGCTNDKVGLEFVPQT